jgi:uncharacterized membrane protein YedE/YeeE
MNEFWPWWWGGLAMGGIATLSPLLSGRLLGVSSAFGALFERREPPRATLSELEAALLAETEAEFGPAPAATEGRVATVLARLRAQADRFRPLCLVGIVLGGLLASVLSGDFALEHTLGARFDARYGSFGLLPALVLLGSGVMIGIGTRLAGGCTSGHGISGVARAQRGSLLTTAVFWCTALLVAWCFVWLGDG